MWLIGLAVFGLSQLEAQTFTNLYSFTGGSDGANPYAGLILSSNTLYGTAVYGGTGMGTNGNGTIFKVNTDGSGFRVLTNFSAYAIANGSLPCPNASLVLSGHTLYGTTEDGGSGGLGSVFKVNTDGSGFNDMHDFSGFDGFAPLGGLVLSNNILYGTTALSYSGGATVFEINTNGGSLTTLTNNVGADPYATLILSSNILYGTTFHGGSSGWGTIFKVNTDGSGFTNLYNFYSYGPTRGSLVLSGNTLFGVTVGVGITGNFGSVFSINTDGSGFTNRYIFTNSANGSLPVAGLALSGNTLYGTTPAGGSEGYGTVFAVNTDGSGFTNLYSFKGGSDGANPYAGLVLFDNALYGTTVNGGAQGYGTVFRISITNANVMIVTPQFSHGGSFQFIVQGLSGQMYVIQTSTNLVNWRPIYTNSGSFIFSDTNVVYVPFRFYRAVKQ